MMACTQRLFLLITVFCWTLCVSGYQVAKAQTFLSHVAVDITQNTYTYTLFNDEPTGNPYYSTDLTLSLPNPTSFVVTGVPDGWQVFTDNTDFVYWYNNDVSLPYPHDVAPGASLTGFVIQAVGSTTSQNGSYEIDSLDHTAVAFGPSALGSVLVPQSTSNAPPPVPEPSSPLFLGAILICSSVLLLWTWRRTRRPRSR